MDRTYRNLFFFLCALCALPEQGLAQGGSLRISLVPYQIDGNKTVEQILSKVSVSVEKAKKDGAELVVFPELLTFDAWPTQTKLPEKDVALQIAKQVSDPFIQGVRKIARKHKAAILAGSTPLLVDGKIRNRSHLVLANGKTHTQDKITLTPWERKMQWEAGDALQVTQLPWGKTVILICYDVESPQLSAALASYQPELVLVPSMTESLAGLARVRWSAQARAVEQHSFVVVSGTIGRPMKDWQHFGQSVFLSPWSGKFAGVLREAPKDSKQIATQTLALESLRKSKKQPDAYYPARDFGQMHSKPVRVVVKP